MKYLKSCWVGVVSLSLLLLLWGGHVLQSHVPASLPNTGLRGYVRVHPAGRNQFLEMRCSVCALVSSSGQMLGAGVGEEIDRAACVFRMNTAPTRGYEKDVGNRTTVRVVSHTSVPLLLREQNQLLRSSMGTTYVFWGPERHMRQDGKGRVFNALLKTAREHQGLGIYTLTKERIQYCDQVFENETGKNRMKTGSFLSTGFFTMILAMDVCESILVYGMVDKNYCSRTNNSVVPYHYFERRHVAECRMYRYHEHARRGGHRFITEKAIYAQWARRHRITFKHPSWSH
ncbi:alpha-N-acetyl-neuraminyl-2,3-beta-galactosyl-1,3-N-acetyl-galactosaminide alpha-2,6-sialyltransferase [Gadus morhua]|uniref:Alpha-N-acetyl-neuraminyl-2,3-beta-galactosyl-1, 3-N-acetyl-galactosaminide alpha-2,6-sialyltransferase n=1 Tax=Gadus morhua TaxID=8049 RepID=A0A8C4ZNJ8_GADMO|nr:alpha-N-acetyl-neuraminyl-2,3-beta-galactosyl-1,3-N-acetyl-galactosaminide alpha-2,6-sialyltransferase-like [Gadus morhua]